MVEKAKSTKAHKSHHTKNVTLHHHHSKPYRKRHVGLLVVSLVGLLVVLASLVQYRDHVMIGVASSRNFVSDLFLPNRDYDATIQSSYGFSLSFDTRSLYANAVDGATGKIYQGRELLQERAYSKLQFAPLSQPNITDQSAVGISYHPSLVGPLSSPQLLDLVFKSGAIKEDSVEFVSSEDVTLGGNTFEKSVWRSKKTMGPIKDLYASFSVYSSIINGHPLIITVNEGFVDIPGTHPQYEDLIKSITFMPQTVEINKQKVSALPSGVGTTLLDTLLMAQVASAQSQQSTASASERIAALYGPAVSRVYNIFCMDIEFEGELLIRDACNGGSGSGFFVSQDGYMATNGHVASMDPKDITIYDAFALAVTGEPTLMNILSEAANLTTEDLPRDASQVEMLGFIADKLYELDDSKFAATNMVHNLLVALGNEKPDTEKLLADTQARKKHEPVASIKHAEVKAVDYRMLDGIDGFKASDVAIIKVEGANFPVVSLGGIDDVVQGASLSILGFPGSANENGLVDYDVSTATLTNGKVSSIKKAAGSERRLIETDTTIGHGNSGGPAFGDSETVVGIATYTLDGSGSGDGVYNYIRDIKDLVDLANRSSITFDTNSETQKEWAQGIEYFYNSRYSKAVVNFEKVRSLYPNHNKAAEFIATANKRIANGQDVKDFPVGLAIAGAAVLLLGVGAGVFFVVRHKKKHNVYRAGVAQGTVAPFTPGVPADPQHVAVQPTVSPIAPQPIAPQPAAPVAVQNPLSLTPPIGQVVQAQNPVPPAAQYPVQPEYNQSPAAADPTPPPKPPLGQ